MNPDDTFQIDEDDLHPLTDDLSIENMAEEVVKQRNRQLKQAISETDWSETAVLHMVTPRSMTPFEVRNPDFYRYDNRAPSIDTYATNRGGAEVITVTEPILRQVGVDPETGEKVNEEGQSIR